MNKHFKISLIKSIIRILGCILSIILVFFNFIGSTIAFSSTFLIAELLGILEEVKDERK